MLISTKSIARVLLSSTFALTLCGATSQAYALGVKYFTADAANVDDPAYSNCSADGNDTGSASQTYTLTLSESDAEDVNACNGVVNFRVNQWLWTLNATGACYEGDVSLTYGSEELFSETFDENCMYYGDEYDVNPEYNIPVSSLDGLTDTFTLTMNSDSWVECYNTRVGDQATGTLDITGFVELIYDGSSTCSDEIKHIASGWYHSFAIRGDDTLWAWGQNVSGQIGDNSTTTRTSAVQVTSLSAVEDVAGGSYHSLALNSSGAVYGWGKNTYGQVGDNTLTTRRTPTLISTITSVKDVEAGANHSLALKTDGTVKAWGLNTSGQLGDGTTTNRRTPTSVSGLTSMTDISGGNLHSLAVKSNGTVWAWGKNTYGQLGDNTVTQRTTPVQATGLTYVTAVSAGYEHSLALKTNGTVWGWGRNNVYQVGDGTTTTRKTAVQLTALSNVSSIASGANHSMAIISDGTTWLWGKNDQGQIGNGTTTTQTVPVEVTNSSLSSTSTIFEIAGGYQHTVSLERYGNVWSWGDNAYGQLGNGTTTDKTSPYQTTETW